jgi:hypothetical protein
MARVFAAVSDSPLSWRRGRPGVRWQGVAGCRPIPIESDEHAEIGAMEHLARQIDRSPPPLRPRNAEVTHDDAQ